MTPYPILFEPILLPKVWGGEALARLGKQLPPATPIGESWELADLPDSAGGRRSVIANGPLAGLTLREAIARHHDELIGAARLGEDGGFPLLVKYLDARENLSVQVHPNAAYANTHPGAHLKSEAWVVIEAAAGAVIYRGVRPGIDAATFRAHVADGSVVDDLVAIPARAGDCHYLPSGTCHALGAGILVAEVQTPSDTTFRVYDWDRSGRELHLDEALACIDFEGTTVSEPTSPPTVEVDGIHTTGLVQTDYFGIERIKTVDRVQFGIVNQGMPMVWMTVAGCGRIRAPGASPVTLATGRTVLLPAAIDRSDVVLEPGSHLLQVTLPSPTTGLLA